MTLNVEIESDHIRIYGVGIEVYWDQVEWETCPTLVPNIANAIKIALTSPELFADLINKDL